MAKFKACVKQEKIQCKALVCLDVATRWNSTYLMLEHAIKFEKAFKILKEEKEDSDFVEYFEEDDWGNKRLGPPSVSDWLTDVVESVKIYLYRLYDFYKSQHNPSTQIGHSTDDLKQSNNVTMEVENDEEVDPWITFCALREEENSMEVEND
ncbi:zinc finger BED domain-containing protein RICESLEEPER 2-like [Cucumis melo var. makuwa]|uniref:Zinc finger BED domain-containing protein RICESLEEPER 2-like n=1 Tax=Cucumis melo var. makuwa TaxID=1194695 RepID=A0A5D3D5Z7_CUCMM|nr:zinc finger BED domain-containing protein RICESLEEPER 2-like [Cucumis melo var. makuwa]